MGALPTLVKPMDLGGFGGPFVVAGTAGTDRLILGFQSATDVDVRGGQNCLPRNRYMSSLLNWMRESVELLGESNVDGVVWLCFQHCLGRGTGGCRRLVVIFTWTKAPGENCSSMRVVLTVGDDSFAAL